LTDNVDAKEELSNVVDLLHQHVEVHNILTVPDRDAERTCSMRTLRATLQGA